MTIASEVNRSGPYACNGATTHFPFGFRIYDAAHIRVILTDPQGTESTLALGTDYIVSGVGQSGGGAVDTGQTYAAGYWVTLILNVPFTQDIDLENQGAYFAETIERAIDLQTQMSLQLKEQVGRAVVLPVTSSVSVDKLTSSVLSLADIQPQMQALVPIAQDIATVAGVSGAVVAAEGNARTATTAAALATSKAAEAAASAEAAALFDPAKYFLKTAFKTDGTGNAPVTYGANGELFGKKLIISGPPDQQRLEFWAGGVDRWIVYRNIDDTFNIWSHDQGTAVVIDPSNNRVNFTALPKVYGNRDVVTLDTDGKLPALDGARLTNLPVPHVGFGVGATPKVPGRAINTWYQNTSADYISVNVTIGAGNGTYYGYVGVSTSNYNSAAQCGMSVSTNIPMHFIVPPAFYYYVSGGSLAGWVETRV